MLVMPRPKKPTAKNDGPEEEKKPQRSGKPVNVWVALDLHAALEAFRKAQRVKPSMTDVVELALQEFLQREGHWPPKGAKAESTE